MDDKNEKIVTFPLTLSADSKKRSTRFGHKLGEIPNFCLGQQFFEHNQICHLCSIIVSYHHAKFQINP